LKHALHLGSVSREQCNALLLIYTEQVNAMRIQLTGWHQSQTTRLSINTDANNRKRLGLDWFIHKPLGLIEEDFNLRFISDKTADIISVQSAGDKVNHRIETIDLFQEDVRVIVKEGKLFYLNPYT